MDALRFAATSITGEWKVQDWLGWIMATLGALALIIAPFLTRRSGKEANEVNERDVNTRAVANVVDVLSEGLAELRTELAEQTKKHLAHRAERDKLHAEQAAKSDERIRCLEEDVRAEKRARQAFFARHAELIRHLEKVEAMVPTPPGPPPRPPWPELESPNGQDDGWG